MGGQWEQAVRDAVLRADGAALARLFEDAVAAEGRTGASRSWLEAVSAFDAEAVTG
jgi:hypothetical protein